MKKINIWIDCDPGIDDAAALAIAAANRDRLHIVGISTVAGNQLSSLVTENALKLCETLGMEDVPVICGAEMPLLRAVHAEPGVHGSDGLGDCGMPPAKHKMISGKGIMAIRDGIMSVPENEKVTLVPTGPFTNIALLLAACPEVKERIDKIVLMGGSNCGGNVSAVAEFNVWADPEAAQMVFNGGIPIVMCGLDVTNYCFITPEQIKQLLQADGRIQNMYGKMFSFYQGAEAYLDSRAPHIHDAVTITYLLHPEIFHGVETYVQVDCSEEINRGMTICDMRSYREEKANTLMLDGADKEAFVKVLLDALRWHDDRAMQQ